MATNPQFIATPRISRCQLQTANTATDGSGTIADLIVGAATGTRILEITAKATNTTVLSQINLFLYDGTQWDLFDQFAVTAVTGSNTVSSYRLNRVYQNLILPSATWKIGATISVAPTVGTVRVAAFGGDL
jgi:hypothetical protein